MELGENQPRRRFARSGAVNIEPVAGPSRSRQLQQPITAKRNREKVPKLEPDMDSPPDLGPPEAVGISAPTPSAPSSRSPSSSLQQPRVKLSANHSRKWTNQLEYLMKVAMPFMVRHKAANTFLHPIDPAELEDSDYFDFIKHPMDITTIRQRLRNHFYKSASECVSDFQRILCNVYVYTDHASPAFVDAELLENLFLEMLVKMPQPEVELPVPLRGGPRKRTAQSGDGGADNLILPRVEKLVKKAVQHLKPDPPRSKKKRTQKESDSDVSSDSDDEPLSFPELRRLKQVHFLNRQLENTALQLRLVCTKDDGMIEEVNACVDRQVKLALKQKEWLAIDSMKKFARKLRKEKDQHDSDLD